MYNPTSILENDTHKLHWDFDIQTDPLISARWLDLIIINKKRTYKIMDFAVPAYQRVKFKEREKKYKFLDLTIFTNPSSRVGYDTRSIFKWSLTGLNSEFSF